MQIIRSAAEIQQIAKNYPSHWRIGFVPTMGYLHEGHLSLIKKSNLSCDITVISIFVNPAQFGPNEDLSRYPRDLDRDIALLNTLNVDYLFFPTEEMMYPSGYKSYINVNEISELYCGASRPGHFRGVATVVAKLVNLVQPHQMFMGEKDYQQIVVLETMLKDLNFSCRIVRCPIIREADGLAMSSRNKYLDNEQRQQALCLSRALSEAKSLYQQGVKDIPTITKTMEIIITSSDGKIDYIAFADANTLLPKEIADDDTRILLAVYIGKTRLIDNIAI